ncbi:MAG: PEGA domain-containing protein [Methanoregula sp.]|jgi:hypothetical protein
MSIYYRGSGGSYIGDTVVFDGINTLGNTTIIKINGPGLPAEGVPPYDITGTPGSGNTIASGIGGAWGFSWDTFRVVGGDQLQTARYTFTVMDEQHPDKTATTSVMLKRPEFYVVISPDPSVTGEYITLTGEVERGANYVRIDVTNADGKSLHTFMAPVSGDGYFQYGFHNNMEPGHYNLQISNPLLKTKIVRVLTVAAPATPAPVTPVPSLPGTLTPTTEPITSSPSQPAQLPVVDGGSISVTSTPAGADLYLDLAARGKTPMTLDNITPGSHTVQIKAPGYLVYSVDVTVKPGETTSVSPELIQGASGMPLSPVIAIFGIIGALAVFWSSRKKPGH